jgi:predicted peptidase
MRKINYLVVLFILFAKANAQDFSLYEKNWFIQNGDTLPYRILLPAQYDPSKKYPLLVFMHGRGESGTDNEKQLVHGARMFLTDSFRTNYPAIIVFPQCSGNSYWSNVQMIAKGVKTGKRDFYFVPDGNASKYMELAISLTKHLINHYPVNNKQVYAMGLSMGGMGTFEIVRRMPGVFAAAIPICGGASAETAVAIAKTKWWVFHGGKDDVVLPQYSITMVEALQKEKAIVKFTLFPDANHNSWDPAFATPGIMQWLFSQKKGK